MNSEVQHKQEAGTKFDGGKQRFDLWYYPFLEEVHTVLVFGAKKYASKIRVAPGHLSVHLSSVCTCGHTTKHPNATQTGPMPGGVCASRATTPNTQERKERPVIPVVLPSKPGPVNPAMIGRSSLEVLNMPIDREATEQSGASVTQIRSRIIAGPTTRLELLRRGIERRAEIVSLWLSELTRPTRPGYCQSKAGDAESAVDPAVVVNTISTTTTRPGGLGGFSAVGATKGSDLSGILKRHLSAHSPICAVHAVEIVPDGSEFIVNQTGAWNWSKGMTYSRLFNAALRHLWAWWWHRQDCDPETGLHHMAHLTACAMFIFGLQRLKRGTDDRPPPELSICGEEFHVETNSSSWTKPVSWEETSS